jgi:hypothetical protein
MAGFTKLFSTIVHSTIWQEELHVKVVWITLLAMADRSGVVEASIPGLAKAAGVSLQECQDSLVRLSSPDPYSRTPDYEGRRIETVPGGWLILNHAKYRERIDKDARRIATAARVRKHRAKKRETITVTPGNAVKRQAEAEAEAEAEAPPSQKTGAARRAKGPSVLDVEIPSALDTQQFRLKWAEWIAYRSKARKAVSVDGARKALAKLAKHSVPVACEAIDQSISNDWQGLFPEKVGGASRTEQTDTVDWSKESGQRL